MKTLISWLAYQHDFIRNNETGTVQGVDKGGTNFNMHKYFYDKNNYDRHVLLCARKAEKTGAEMLYASLKIDYPEHELEIDVMDIIDPIDLSEIKPKVEAKIMQISKDEIDIFVSPGTPAMFLAWYICHTTLGLKTRLIQTRPGKFTRSGEPELLTIEVEKSGIPVTSVIRERLADLKVEETSDYFVTDSIRSVYHNAELIAQTDKVTVLILGSTGTGKEHLAKYLHEKSIRKNKPYVSINCSAFNDQLLESRLFGYKKGSFTGADKDTSGLFEEANNGTIFLDEIGDITPYMQQSLLRVLQEKEILPVGGKPVKINVRVISATNKNLLQLCKEGKFRWDLYYRLAVTELELPSLQSRGSKEIDEMLDFFLNKKRHDLKKPLTLKLNEDLRSFLKNYGWPGNVRELENLIETFYVYCSSEVAMNNLPTRMKELDETVSLRWEDVEKAHILKVLKLKNGNQRQAWIALGYGSINTLRNKINDYNISLEQFSQ